MKTYEPEAGENIYGAVQSAIRIAKLEGREVRMAFNEIDMIVSPNSWEYDITTIYGLKSELRRFKTQP